MQPQWYYDSLSLSAPPSPPLSVCSGEAGNGDCKSIIYSFNKETSGMSA